MDALTNIDFKTRKNKITNENYRDKVEKLIVYV